MQPENKQNEPKDKYLGVDPKGGETPFAQEVFLKWHSNSRNISKTAQEFGLSRSTLTDWVNRFGWDERAEKARRQAAKQLDEELLLERKGRLKQCLKTGKMLRSKGTEFLLQNPNAIKDAETALRFIKVGIDIESDADPLPAFMESISVMPDDQLAALVVALTERKALSESERDD